MNPQNEHFHSFIHFFIIQGTKKSIFWATRVKNAIELCILDEILIWKIELNHFYPNYSCQSNLQSWLTLISFIVQKSMQFTNEKKNHIFFVLQKIVSTRAQFWKCFKNYKESLNKDSKIIQPLKHGESNKWMYFMFNQHSMEIYFLILKFSKNLVSIIKKFHRFFWVSNE